LKKDDKGDEYILESKAKKRSTLELPAEKSKYSIVDPEAEPLGEETRESND
jgi:hypothetical protein